MSHGFTRINAVLILLLFAHTALAQVPVARPESVSVSTQRLAQVDAVIARAPRVQNRIPAGANWDGADDPALQAQTDVKVMVSEQQQAPRS